MHFELLNTDNQTKARRGKLYTDHGVINTPIFMPVGTVASVKSVHQQELTDKVQAQIILGNTYHLYLRPGMDVMQQAGGLHKFMNWNRPILTDSGGFQVFSLAANRKLTLEGAAFRSHIDGSKHLFTPEKVVDIQRQIGSDIMMAFDECPPYPSTYKYAKESMELTHHWLQRGFEHFKNSQPLYGYQQAFFPIVQGSTFDDLRRHSAHTIAQYDTLGCAIGGLSVGEPTDNMYKTIEVVNEILPTDKPRYLMGVGTPANILEGIARGIDMFDCVMPTRNARNGMLFTADGKINIKNKKWQHDFSPIDASLENGVSNFYSKAYLRHLLVANERLAAQIASIHNLSFYLWLVNRAQQHIEGGTFSEWKQKMLPALENRL